MNLPDADGFELASPLAALGDSLAVVLTFSRDGAELRVGVAGSGARRFVAKAQRSREATEELPK